MPRKPPIYVRLPDAPITGSPVPDLCSIFHKDDPGTHRDRRYPGNCGGELIKDLLRFFRPKRVFDPMTGSGTCRQVCAELGIPCVSSDLKKGFDACDPDAYPVGQFDFIWLHPPYWRAKQYSNDPRDLSAAPTLEAFLERYQRVIENCTRALAPGGKLVILMGDYIDREAGYLPLTYHTKRLGFACGLRQPCTDIIRFSHGTSSSKKTYRSAVIPTLHDTCMILEKPRLRQRALPAPALSPADPPLPHAPFTNAPASAIADTFHLKTGEEIMAKRKELEAPAAPAEQAQQPPADQSPEAPDNGPADQGKPRFKDPFDFADDYAAGVHLAESKKFRQMQMRFDEKPPQPVLEAMRASNWTFRPEEAIWTIQIPWEAPRQTRIDAEQLFQEVRNMVREAKGLPAFSMELTP